MNADHVDAGALFRRHAGFVTNFLLRHGTPPEDVADVVQEVFLVAHRKGGFSHTRAKPTSWLAAIAIRVASDRRRKRNRKRLREPVDMEAVARSAAPSPSPRERAETREQLKRVRRALRTMPGAKRAVFVMFEIEGRTCEEIAAAFRIPVGTVYSRLHSARAQFARNYRSPTTDRPLALSDSLSFVSVGA